MVILLWQKFTHFEIDLIGLPLSITLGFLSYKLVEQPAPRLRRLEEGAAIKFGFMAVSCSLCGILIGIFFTHRSQDFLKKSRPKAAACENI
jgi:hypothetical protein